MAYRIDDPLTLLGQANERTLGVWPTESERQRAAPADAYLEIVICYSAEDYAAELELDEGSGVLLSEPLETTQIDVDRIEPELGRLRSELRDDDELQM
jgi:hypothetical protein